jgi:hypothetical protein
MNRHRLSTSYLARQEIRRRPGQFALSALAVATGVAVVVGSLVLLAAEDRSAQDLLQSQREELDQRFAAYGGTLAEAMTKAGYNVIILPRDQELDDWYQADFAAKSLPTAELAQLGDAPLRTIQHLLPRLTGRFEWPERKWTVIVYGVSPAPLHPTELGKRWLDRSVPSGQLDVGSEIAHAFALAPGQDLAVGGTVFRIRRCLPETGTKEDIALRLALSDAQRLLGRPGEVNEILALEAPAAWGDIAQVRAELAERLPSAQAMEIRNRVVAMARARRMADEESRALLEQERQRQENLRTAHRRLATGASLAAIAVSAVWLVVMTALNLSRRRSEIGLLSAMGLPAGEIRTVFLTRLLLAALCGIVVGALPWCLLGHLPSPTVWLLAAAAAAVPATLTAAIATHCQIARRDPAEVLKNES